jgi:hypothetical protein
MNERNHCFGRKNSLICSFQIINKYSQMKSNEHQKTSHFIQVTNGPEEDSHFRSQASKYPHRVNNASLKIDKNPMKIQSQLALPLPSTIHLEILSSSSSSCSTHCISQIIFLFYTKTVRNVHVDVMTRPLEYC